jgi:cytochrome c oxidase assembly protein subunit 15
MTATTLPYHANPQCPDPAAGGGPLHVIALLTACATFPLIFMGGLVTSHGAGLSVPDWPNSFHYNMFLFPPRLWVGGILYEHTHRLMATVVGLLSIILVVTAHQTAWATRREKLLAWGVLGLVILQGILGGLRVVLVKLDLAIAHACLGQAFFCYATFVAMATSRWWQQRYGERRKEDRSSLAKFGVVTVVIVFAQLLVGATMRHYQAGLAIPDFPLSYGKLIPPTNQAELDAANLMRVDQPNLDSVTLGQIWLHFSHRIGALIVTLFVLHVATTALLRYSAEPRIRRPAKMLLGLLPAQIALGIMTVLFRKPADIASAHVAVGALVLVTTFVLTARAWRMLQHPLTMLDDARQGSLPTSAIATAT